MARIPEEEIERLKQEIPIERLARAKGVVLKPHGGNLIGLCPFHEDHEPSLVITPSKNLWHCLGACQSGGSVIDWVMKAEGVSFRHAVEIIRRDPSSLAAFPDSTKHSSRKLAPVLGLDAEDREILRQVIDYYHATLKESPEVLRYLEKRGLRSPEMIERFKLGFANRTLGYRLPPKRCKAGEEIRGRLQRLGIYRASGHEHFTGSLVIPVMDEAGSVAEVYGRKIRDDLPDRSPIHLYLPGPHKGVWNVEALVSSKEIILCEALIDALTFWSAGYRNVTSSYGIQGFSDDHLKAFKRYGTERVLIAYDRDDAGERAAEILAEKLMKEGIACYRIRFPRGMDANECALKMAPAERILGVLIRGASYLGSGKPPVREAGAEPCTDCGAERMEPAAGGKIREGAKIEDERNGPLLLAASGELALNDPEHKAAKEKKEAEEPGTLTASPHEPHSPEPIPAQIKEDEVVIALGERRWRVRGLSRNMTFGQLRVNVLVSVGEGYHVETLDLYSARQRAGFIKAASQETKIAEEDIKKDLGKVLLKLEEIQEEMIRKALEPEEKTVTLTNEEREEALSFLKAPGLLGRILQDFERCGVVGEETNKLVGYLACVSRKLEDPLAVIIQSSSAAGKSSLMESILAFTPEEDRVKYSAMTGQSLFYMGEKDLASKVLALVEEEGAQRASYALKLLQSEGELTIASTGKDPATGRLVTQEYKVTGPVVIFLTTTAIDIDEEFLNRCIVLTVDEDREQTRAIHRLQREAQTLSGLLAGKERDETLKLHRNGQRLIEPLLVANPFAPDLTFLDIHTRTRRDHMKYLTLIRAIALLHQHQRPVKEAVHRGKAVRYIEVTLDDIETANRLASDVLGRTLDELPPQTRRFLDSLSEMVTSACRGRNVKRSELLFSRREIRESLGLSYDQVRVHLGRLVDLEYVLVHRAERGQSFVYELLYDGSGKAGEPFLMGLCDVAALKKSATTTTGLGGEAAGFGGGLGGRSAPGGASFGSEKQCEKPGCGTTSQATLGKSGENTYGDTDVGSHHTCGRSGALSSLAARVSGAE